MPDRRYRVLAVATHPVQYMTPLFRRLANHPAVDFQVAAAAAQLPPMYDPRSRTR